MMFYGNLLFSSLCFQVTELDMPESFNSYILLFEIASSSLVIRSSNRAAHTEFIKRLLQLSF